MVWYLGMFMNLDGMAVEVKIQSVVTLINSHDVMKEISDTDDHKSLSKKYFLLNFFFP